MASSASPDIPECLTHEYVENILKNYFKDTTLKVINLDITPAIPKGESYCSIMSRVTAKYKVGDGKDLKQIRFLAKTSYDSGSHFEYVLKQYDVWNTEMQMYETVMPQLQQLLLEIGDKDQLCAKTIYVDHQHNNIIFEDLSVRDFVMANRLEGLDEITMKLCLKKLAKMHAAAAVLNERQSGSLTKFSHGILNRHVNVFGQFLVNVMKVSAKFAESCNELGPYYRDKLLQLLPYADEYAIRCYDPHPKHFCTLNHGDVWTNNVMIQYDTSTGGTEKTVKDVLLIDFQYCNWATPAVDLNLFFSTSLQDDLLFNKQPQLIQYYHQVLSETLEKLKFKQNIPTLQEFNEQLNERAFYAVATLLVNFPLMINDKTEDADFHNIVGNDERAQRFHNLLYTNERVQRIIKVMLPRFDKRGLLDIVK